ncbi:negative elongation factor E-like [Physella acuta]|uniref:negative elongation factor E-like n=1 Tax=Physella acuta TaxID=109671 RepID=UPI0027DB8553|nr:negative elongation factor E-like [Physella acuta]XP_059173928.1 negative elongation factor E-like [Physella acuta]
MHFPIALTEEEEILKQTLARLKKKKKQLQSLKSAANSQEKETTLNKSASKPVPAPSIDAADKATEQAKKLVQSGAIKVQSQKEKFGFKRSKNFEKKKDNDKPTGLVTFQPFNSFSADEEVDKPQPPKRFKSLNDSFVSGGYSGRNHDNPKRDPPEAPKKGNTVYVNGIGITEDMIRKSFSHYGNIININMELEKHNAFVTFDKMEAAEQAIANTAGSMINNIQLRVQMARRQPSIEALVEGSSQSSWGSIAASSSQKGTNHKDTRQMINYENDMF